MRSSCSSERSKQWPIFFTLTAHSACSFVFVWMLACSSSWWYSLRGSIHTFDSSRGLELEVEVHDRMVTAVFYPELGLLGGGGVCGGVSHVYMITIKSWGTLLYANSPSCWQKLVWANNSFSFSCLHAHAHDHGLVIPSPCHQLIILVGGGK